MPKSLLRGLAVLLVGLLLLVGCQGSPTPEPPPQVATPTASALPLPPARGRIAFLSARNGAREAWVVRADGSGQAVVTPGRALVAPSIWAPDGKRLAYVFDQGGKAQIGVLTLNDDNTVGANVVLTGDAATGDNTTPAWAPDGSQIAFQSNRTGSYQVFTMPAAVGAVTSYPGQPPYAGGAAWSPDGKTLLFSAGADAAHTELYSVAAAGGTPFQITNNGRAAARPTWMPDGQSLLFMFQTPTGTHNIAEIRPDGTGQRDLTTGPQEDLFPVPAPDSKWIAFHSTRTSNTEVFVMDRDGGALTNISANPAGDQYPSWSPDSDRLVFTSGREGGYRLYLIGRDGGNLAPLTRGDGAYDDTFPIWSPK
jgi:TolB protein